MFANFEEGGGSAGWECLLQTAPRSPSFSSSLLSPKMHLAQELVDYVVDFLHDDPTTLIQLSLVSKAWVGRARMRLCETLHITRRKLIFADLSFLAPLCGHAKIIHLTWPTDLPNPVAVMDCFEQSKPHTLAIHSCELRSLDEQTIRRYFAKFPCATITTLAFHAVSPTHRVFLALLSLFPNVDNLLISVNRCWGDRPSPVRLEDDYNEIVQRTSPPRYTGTFTFSDPPGHGVWGYQRGELLRTIAVFPLQFQAVSLSTKEQSWEDALIFLDSCSKTVRKLFVELASCKYQTWVFMPHIPGCSECKFLAPSWVNRPSIDLPNLEELHVGVPWSDVEEPHPLLRSITFPQLRRMVIETEAAWWLPPDEFLADLVRKHNTHGDFTLRISTRADPEYIRGKLPLVVQQGVLEVCHNARPDYSI